MWVHACIPSTWETETGRLKFKMTLGYKITLQIIQLGTC